MGNYDMNKNIQIEYFAIKDDLQNQSGGQNFSTFIYQKENAAKLRRMFQLQSECTHEDENGNIARDSRGQCLYCEKPIGG